MIFLSNVIFNNAKLLFPGVSHPGCVGAGSLLLLRFAVGAMGEDELQTACHMYSIHAVQC